MMSDNSDTNSRMILFSIEYDQSLLAAIGSITVRHGQLIYSMRMMVKSLAKISIQEALNATASYNFSDLREKVKKLAKRKLGEGQDFCKVEALLHRAKVLSEDRNQLMHAVFAHELDGEPVMTNYRQEWDPVPSIDAIELKAKEMFELVNEMNSARLEGFLFEALE